VSALTAMGRAKEWAKRLWEPGGTLSQRVVRGGIWVFALRIASRVLTLIRTIVLARVLAPSDFGLMGIALLAMSATETFSQTGFQAALIQKKGDIKDYLDTAWTVSALRGLVLFAVLYLAAPYIALFFDTPAATPMMRVIGLSMLLNGLTNIGVVYFRKELEFNKQFIYQLSGTVADLVVAITAALLLRSVWALVFGLLAGNFARFVMSYLICPYRPRVRFERARANELHSFGRWILGSSILVFLLTQGDDALVGKVLSTTALGFYQMAYRISNAPATEISAVISQVTFPAYSKLRDSLSSLRKAYLKTLQLTALISIPVAGGIFILAPEFTTIFLGAKWMPMVPAMRVLALYGLLRSIGFTGSVFMAVGRPELRTKLQFAALILMAIVIYPLTVRWGIMGTSIAVTIYALVNIVGIYIALKVTECNYKKAAQVVLLPLVDTAIMIFVVFALKTYVFDNVGPAWFLLLTVGGIFTYLSIAHLLDLLFNCGNKKLIQEQLTNLFQKFG